MNTVSIKNPQLANAVNMNRQNPLTFEIPSLEERTNRKIGDSVKVCVKGERFWVEIIDTLMTVETDASKENHTIYIGRIDNDLIRSESHNLYFNDLIKFCPDNIYSINPPAGPLGMRKVCDKCNKGKY